LLTKARLPLCNMRNGQMGTVVEINGGIGIVSKLDSLGIRMGVSVIKKSALIARGPLVVQVHGTEIAMGYGMASKIVVEVG
jgi:ferrous iron transport protein A